MPLGQDTITLTVSDGIHNVDVVASAITEWIDIVNAFLDGAYPDHESADDVMTSWLHRHGGAGDAGDAGDAGGAGGAGLAV